MFGLFKKKTEKEKLQETYAKLMKESYKVSHTNRTASDKLMAEAEEVAKKIDTLQYLSPQLSWIEPRTSNAQVTRSNRVGDTKKHLTK